MFKNLTNLTSMIKQAQEMSSKMKDVNSQLQHVRIKGIAGGGMVEIEVTGQMEPLSCKIEESLLKPNNRELLEDMVVVAIKEALREAREKHTELMQSMTEGLDIPGLSEQMSQLMQ